MGSQLAVREGHNKILVPKLIPALEIKLSSIWKARYSNFRHPPCTRSSLPCPFHPSADPWPLCKQPDAAPSHLSLCGTGRRSWNFYVLSFSLTLFASSLSCRFHFYNTLNPFFFFLPPVTKLLRLSLLPLSPFTPTPPHPPAVYHKSSRQRICQLKQCFSNDARLNSWGSALPRHVLSAWCDFSSLALTEGS